MARNRATADTMYSQLTDDEKARFRSLGQHGDGSADQRRAGEELDRRRKALGLLRAHDDGCLVHGELREAEDPVGVAEAHGVDQQEGRR